MNSLLVFATFAPVPEASTTSFLVASALIALIAVVRFVRRKDR